PRRRHRSRGDGGGRGSGPAGAGRGHEAARRHRPRARGRTRVALHDEPFSALDVLTAESLRSEVYGLWTRGDFGLQGMLLITHLIEEAVFLGDRIVIMGTNPGTIRELLTNPLPHPREYRDPAFIALVD